MIQTIILFFAVLLLFVGVISSALKLAEALTTRAKVRYYFTIEILEMSIGLTYIIWYCV